MVESALVAAQLDSLVVLVPLRQGRYRRYVYMVTRPGLAASASAA